MSGVTLMHPLIRNVTRLTCRRSKSLERGVIAITSHSTGGSSMIPSHGEGQNQRTPVVDDRADHARLGDQLPDAQHAGGGRTDRPQGPAHHRATIFVDRRGLPGRDFGTTGLRLRAGRARPQPAAQPISITSSTASEGIAPTPPPSDMARRGTRHCAKTTGMMGTRPTRQQFVASSIAATSAAGLLAAQDEKPKIIDAWGHVSLPRFLSAEEFLAILDANGAEGAIVGTAATCPDLRELSRAAVQHGDRLRAIGMPMGRVGAGKIRVPQRTDGVRIYGHPAYRGLSCQASSEKLRGFPIWRAARAIRAPQVNWSISCNATRNA